MLDSRATVYFALVNFLLVLVICISSLLRSHWRYKNRTVFESEAELPSWLYLLCRVAVRKFGARGRRADEFKAGGGVGIAFTLLNCRLNSQSLRRFCEACGYGWDYPDSTGRDIPLCYPEILFTCLLVMIISSDRFRLSPLGLINVRSFTKTFQPVDEIKKGPFLLQASLVEYRSVEAGTEVDIALELKDQAMKPVWKSEVTLLQESTNSSNTTNVAKSEDPKDLKVVNIQVPRITRLKHACASVNYDCVCVLWLVIKQLLGHKDTLPNGFWMVSRCMAELEKYQGTDAVRAPVCVQVTFNHSLLRSAKAIIKFWKMHPETSMVASRAYQFKMEESESGILYAAGSSTMLTWHNIQEHFVMELKMEYKEGRGCAHKTPLKHHTAGTNLYGGAGKS
ncbi:uncharacterized protein si:ch211-12e13.1 [Polypterus senegalus]|uniref:uncharacterized protein si:ch211-12e13.1 n=1 Tax=Polypterus senegalus TaxID=55291 RepID=UPI001966A41F|nr:uncharacterized protein si:ch211-12e13.1 [Polypterus senegalus]